MGLEAWPGMSGWAGLVPGLRRLRRRRPRGRGAVAAGGRGGGRPLPSWLRGKIGLEKGGIKIFVIALMVNSRLSDANAMISGALKTFTHSIQDALNMKV